MPAGFVQTNLTSMSEIEADVNQSVQRVPAGSSATMFDMLAFDPTGRFLFIPHETPFGAGLSRYDVAADSNELLFAGDQGGITGNWANDFAAFDPARWTPNRTVLVAEEWDGLGRVVEILNPLAPVDKIRWRVLESFANTAHEGINFSEKDRNRVIYYIDEWNSGAIYKLVLARRGDYTKGQTFVLKVDAYAGVASDDWNQASNATQPRTGPATWIPITDEDGERLTSVDPFRDGPTNDPRTATDTRGGRPAADEVSATPYGRPEDMEVGRLANGNEVVYFAATSENRVYSIEILSEENAIVREFAGPTTPHNVGFAPTTGTISSPDNLALDSLGNLYIIEDKPNSDAVGGDTWFGRDVDNDGVAESLDHFLSVRVDGSEATGLVWHPRRPDTFVIAVMHPDSTDLAAVPNGFGDAIWEIQVTGMPRPGRP
jgi:secreted PhoX family phosphatase